MYSQHLCRVGGLGRYDVKYIYAGGGSYIGQHISSSKLSSSAFTFEVDSTSFSFPFSFLALVDR